MHGSNNRSGSSSQVRQSGNSTQVRGSESDTYIVKDVNQVDVSNQINRQSSSDSQVRRSSSSSQTRQSGSSSQVRGSSSSSGQSSQVRSSSSSSVRSNTNVTKGGLGTVTSQMRSQSGSNTRVSGGRPGSRMNNADDFRINNHDVERIPPRDRGFMPYDRPGHFYDHHHPHCFGFRVEVLPPRYRVVRYFGVDYYIYNDVYYRPYHGHYIVCRPPFGVTITAAVADMTFAAVNFAYYNNVYRTYSAIDANNRYIDQQNRIIAQNNATILAQNNAIAMNPTAALSSYEIASRLGLVQSYAFADRNYFYQDGIFYIVNGNGQYQTIVPPAGALVQSLPEDYDIITLNGVQYYRVDDTVSCRRRALSRSSRSDVRSDVQNLQQLRILVVNILIMIKIGVFDSGEGGLSVLKEITRLLPEAEYVYYSDNAHCPYGEKSPEYIQDRARAITERLLKEGADVIVVACNTATAAAISVLRAEYSDASSQEVRDKVQELTGGRHDHICFIGMEPAVKPAALGTRTGVVGVLATAGTLKGSKYLKTKESVDDQVNVFEHVGRGFVELVEKGRLSGRHRISVPP